MHLFSSCWRGSGTTSKKCATLPVPDTTPPAAPAAPSFPTGRIDPEEPEADVPDAAEEAAAQTTSRSRTTHSTSSDTRSRSRQVPTSAPVDTSCTFICAPLATQTCCPDSRIRPFSNRALLPRRTTSFNCLLFSRKFILLEERGHPV